jgi:hypothetical protein
MDAIILSGALVHVPHHRLMPVLANILGALKAGGHVFLSLKAGEGFRRDETGRLFHLWQDEGLRRIFQRLGLIARHLSRQPSATGSGEIWLGYILQKGAQRVDPEPGGS